MIYLLIEHSEYDDTPFVRAFSNIEDAKKAQEETYREMSDVGYTIFIWAIKFDSSKKQLIENINSICEPHWIANSEAWSEYFAEQQDQ